MKITGIALILVIGILMISCVACGPSTYQLTTYTEGQGSISPSVGVFSAGSSITLTAIPASGWEFDHWGGNAVGSGNPISVNMNFDKTIYAYFVENTEPAPASMVQLVPYDANFVVSVQVGEILLDGDVHATYNDYMSETFTEMLDFVKNNYGIDSIDFSDVLVFGYVEPDNYWACLNSYSGAIIKGNFDQQELIESVEDLVDIKAQISYYDDFKIYSLDGYYAACFLNDEYIALGVKESVVRDIIKVYLGHNACLSGQMYDTYNSFGDVWIKGVADVPDGALSDLSELDIPVDLTALEDIQLFGVSIDKAGTGLSLQIKVRFSNTASAATVRGMVNSLTGFVAPLTLDISPDLRVFLDELAAIQDGAWLTVTMEKTRAQIEDLLEALIEYY